MNYIQIFKDYLLALRPTPSKVTVKNYAIDVKHFIVWIENKFHQSFNPTIITIAHIEQFKQEKQQELALRSLERHISSLRKFFQALKMQGIIAENPFEVAKKTNAPTDTDPFHLKRFKDFLYVYNASTLTIKNYIIDVRQFFNWAQKVTNNEGLAAEQLLERIDEAFVAAYRNQLITEEVFSPASINRKLSSLRKYLTWAASQNFILAKEALQTNLNNVSNNTSTKENQMPKRVDSEAKTTTEDVMRNEENTYSPFPPFRLAQKLGRVGLMIFDIFITSPLTHVARTSHKIAWHIQGKPLFTKSNALPIQASGAKHAVQSLFPRSVELKNLPWHEKLVFHAKNTRPNWYKRYHSYAISHYFHWAILMIFMTAIGFGFYNNFVEKPKSSQPALAATPPRILSFQGRLTDANNNPITGSTNLRFGIYNDLTASGSALQWQEVDNVTPDANGVFSVLLGNSTTIPQSVFGGNSSLFLGVTVGSTAELTPRQQLATVAYATNAETLQGLQPITNAGGNTTNVVLALDGSGNLTIGGSATPVFTASGGQFTLAGKTLTLSTVAGSNTNVQLAPDGKGLIDVQKPLTNTTHNNNIASAVSAVEVDSLFAVLATSSGQSAVTINQNGTGPIISASASGNSIFTVANSGAITDANYTTGGGILFANSSGLFLQTPAGTTGQCLTSAGGGTPTWGTCGGGGGTNFWTLTNGALYPVNTTLDVFFGGTASSSANFAFINNAAGTPTASIAGNLTLNSATGSIQSTNNQPLTIGGNSTGNIILSPNNGTGTVTVNGTGLQTTATTFNFLTSTATTVNFAQAATALNVGATGGTTTFASAAINDNQATVALLGSPTTVNFAQAATSLNVGNSAGTTTFASNIDDSKATLTLFATPTTVNIGSSSQTDNFSGNVTLGTNTSNTITPNGLMNADLIPTGNGTINLGSSGHYYNTVYANNFVAPITGGTSGFWSLTNDVIFPVNTYFDLAIGGTSTASADFQVFSENVGSIVAGTATTSGYLSFRNANTQINLLNNANLNIQRSVGGDAGLTSALYIQAATGNIGIGTTTPSSFAVQVAGNVGPNATDTYNLGSPSLEWNNIYVKNIVSSGTISGFWQLNSGALAPTNITNDILAGSTATTSAKFAVLNMTGSGTPTASVSSGLNGTGLSFAANGTIQTTSNQGLTIGGNTTGNITLAPLNGGTGSTVNLNAATLATNQTSVNLLNTTATTINFGAAATTLNIANNALTTTIGIGGTSGTTTVNNALTATGVFTANNNVILGATNANTINPVGVFSGSLIPQSTTINVGSSTNYFGSGYITNLFPSGTSQYMGFWQLNSGALAPTNITNDILAGATATTSAKFAVLNMTGSGTPTASVSSGLNGTGTYFDANGNIQTVNNASLKLGGTTTGNIIFNSNVASNILPYTTSTYDLGSVSKVWNNLYVNNIISGGNYAGFWQRNLGVLSATNITDDLAIGGTATASAKFQVFANTGNATTAGNLTFNTSGLIQTTNMQPLTIGSASTGPIQLSPKGTTGLFVSGTGSVGIGTTNPQQSLQIAAGNLSLDNGQAIYLDGPTDGAWKIGREGPNPTGAQLNTTAATVITVQNSTANQGLIVRNAGGTSLFEIQGSNGQEYVNGTVGIGTAAPLTASGLDVEKNALGNAAVVINQLGLGDVFTASVSGTTVFTIKNSGSLALQNSNTITGVTNYTEFNNGISVGGATTYGITSSGVGNLFSGSNVTNNGPSFFQVGSTAGSGSFVRLYADVNVVGDFALTDGNANSYLYENVTGATLIPAGSLGIGKNVTSPHATLDVEGGNTGGNAALIVNQNGATTNDILDASASGTLKFAIQNDGTIIAKKYTTQAGLFYLADTAGTVGETAQGSTGQCLISNGSAAPSWANCATGTAGTNWWNVNNGAIYPINSTLDLLLGSTATTSAKFAVLNMTGSGTPTASVSSGLNGTGTYFDANGNIQTVNNMGMTIGGSTTGNITLSPLNGGTGSTVSINATSLATTQSTIGVFDANATTVNFAGGANAINIGNTGGTTTFRSATINDNQASVTLFGTPTTVTFGGAATTLTIGKSGGTTTNLGNETINGNVTLGTNTSNTITPNGIMNADLIPTGNGTINLGSGVHYYNTVYANNFVAPVGNGTAGYWSLSNDTLFPVNTFYDLAVGGTGTGSATPWQVFATTVGVDTAGTATSSAGLSFRGTNTNLALLNGSVLNVKTSVGGDAGLGTVLTLANNGDITQTGNFTSSGNVAVNGGTLSTTQTSAALFNANATTVNIAGGASAGFNLGHASGTNLIRGSITLGSSNTNTITATGEFNSSLIPSVTNTDDLGSSTLAWRNLYISGNYDGLWQRFSGVVSPYNITDDLAIGGTGTSSAKFQVFANTGNATTAGTLTFTGSPATIQTTSMLPLTIGSSSTGPIQLSPKGTTGLFVSGTGNVGDGTTAPQNSLDVNGGVVIGTYAGNTANTQSNSLSVSGFIGLGTTNPGGKFDIEYADSAANGTAAIKVGNTAAGGGNWYVRGGATGTNTLPGGISLANDTNYWFNVAATGGVGIGANTNTLTNIGNAELVVNQTNTLGTGDIFTASTSGVAKFTIANDGTIKNSLIPNLVGASGIDTLYNLGSVTAEWDTLYVRQIVTPSTGGLAGYWQLSSGGVLAPANITNDLAIGGIATSTAKFQVFANTGNATTTGSLTFNSGAQATNLIAARDNQGITIGDSQTGNIIFNGGNVGIGTTNPLANLVLGGTGATSNPAYFFMNDYSNGSNGSASIVGNWTSSKTWGIGAATNTSDNTLRIGNVSGSSSSPANTWSATQNLSVLLGGNLGISALKNSGLDIEQNSLGNSALVVNNSGGLGDILTASSGGTTKFVINSSGNVGIDTATPTSPLHIGIDSTTVPGILIGAGSNVQNFLSISGGRGMFGYNGSNALVNAGTNHGIAFYVNGNTTSFANGTEAMFINASGNVGIGTTSQISLLDTEGNIIGKALTTFNEIGGDQNIITASASGTTEFTVGNTGIVTASSFQDLQNTAYFVDPAATGLSLNLAGNASLSGNLTFNGGGAQKVDLFNDSSLGFYTSVGGVESANPSLFIANAASGYVGSGTSAPLYPFDVVQSASGNNGIGIRTTATANSPFLTFGTADASNNLYSMRLHGGATTPFFSMGTGDSGSGYNAQFSIVPSSGNVGIGTTTPQELLSVVGNIQVGPGELGTPTNATIRGAQASGTDIVGADLNINASNGTGKAGSGNLIFQTSQGGIGFDNAGSAAFVATGGAKLYVLPFKIGSGTNRALVVSVGYGTTATGATVSSIRYGNSQFFSLVGTVTNTNNFHEEIWVLAAPTTGTTNINVNWSANLATGTVTDIHASSWTGVNQATPMGSTSTNTGNSSLQTVTVTGAGANDYIYAADTSGAGSTGSLTPEDSDSTIITERFVTGSNSTMLHASSFKTVITSPTFIWANADGGGPASHNWAAIGAPLKAASSSTADALAEAMRIDKYGHVGIATASPDTTSMLTVSNPNFASFINILGNGDFSGQDANAGNGYAGIKFSRTDSLNQWTQLYTSFTTDDMRFCYNNGPAGTTQGCKFRISSDNSTGIVAAHGTLAGQPDIAEPIFVSDPTINQGDIVSPDQNASESASKTSLPYDESVLGAISNDPSLLIGAKVTSNLQVDSTGTQPLVLAGRIPLKVSTINGPIKIGDSITSSTLPGIGMKATKAGKIVARAYYNFNPDPSTCQAVPDINSIQWATDDWHDTSCYKLPDGTLVGKIISAINPGWYDPQTYLTATGDFQLSNTTQNADFTVPSYFSLNDALGNPIDKMGAFLELVVANLRAGTIKAQQTITGTLAVTTDTVSIAGQSLRDYILSVVRSAQLNGTLSPIAAVDQIHTNLISPLASDSAIALDLTGSKFTIRNSSTGSAVATIDNAGNATFSGTLNSQNFAVNSDATVSGTLRAHRIVADDIEGLTAIVSTLSAQNITNVTNMYFATPSGTATSENIAMGQSSSSSSSSGALIPSLGYTNIGTYSSFLAYVPSLSATTAVFDNGLSSLGTTALSDTTITGQLSIGATLTLANNSINVLGQSLEIQPLRQGGVNFEGGLLAIDTDGNLTVNGNAVFGKTLAAHIISPLSNNDNLTFQLGQNPTATGSALATANLSVQNASGSGIFSVDQLGNLVASGAANIAKLNFNFVQPALAVSDTEVIATGSAGTAVIKAHQTEITIDNPQVTSKSLIYITPVGQSVVTPYLIRQGNGTSFTVGISLPQNITTNFNWLIVN